MSMSHDAGEPGNCFAVIDAHPAQLESCVTAGVAAATKLSTKLSFEVAPWRYFELWPPRIAHFLEDNSLNSMVPPPVLAGIFLFYLLSQPFRLVDRRR